MINDIKKFPCYVQLTEINPYGDRVVCNGIVITTTNRTKITNKAMYKKIESVEKYLKIFYTKSWFFNLTLL